MDWKKFATVAVVARTIEHRGEQIVVHIKELATEEAGKIFDDIRKGVVSALETRKRLLAASIVDEAGQPALTQDEAAQLPVALAAKMEAQAMAVNGFTPDSQAALGNGSGSTAPSSSASDSPATSA